MLVKDPARTTDCCSLRLRKHLGKPPRSCDVRLDQGKEMHAHKRFTVATNVQVTSAIRAVLERGQNENTTVGCVSTSEE